MTVDRVVIIGAGTAGLLAAAAAVAAGKAVTVVERDRLAPQEYEAGPQPRPGVPQGPQPRPGVPQGPQPRPGVPQGPQPRPGVPQGQQPHVFLYRGLLAAEELLPGLRGDLLAAGAIPFDTAALAWLGEQGWNTREASSYQVFSTTRPLLEAVIRRRVSSLPGLRIQDATTVTEVKGVATEWTVRLSDGTYVVADLVVDASGRNSRLPHWLADRYPDNIRTTEIDAKIGYATRIYQGNPEIGDLPGVVIGSTPREPVGGLALPVEQGRWMIGAVGFGDHRPTRDVAEFDKFLWKLRDPALGQLAGRMEPVSEVMIHRQTGNRRHHYEELKGWPDGLLVMGDAFCAFNPVYGQGIAVAACQAVLLRDELRSGLRPGHAHRLLRRFAQVVELPWSIATGQDLRYPTSKQAPTRIGALSNRWAMELGKLAVHGDVRAAVTLGGVYHLMVPSSRLFHPALVCASIRGRLRGYGPATQRPAGLPLIDGSEGEFPAPAGSPPATGTDGGVGVDSSPVTRVPQQP